ncbi:MAG: carboxymuconolactone decarboxylase [Thermoleophilia bacterium]|nr:carboxymuconolactone decarboxylase [Thermoleophilia bacterium]
MSDAPVLDLLAQMTVDSVAQSTLDGRDLALVRLAGLVASDAPPISYLANLGAAADLGLEVEDVQGVLIGVAPIVGTARVMTAAGNIARALGVAVAVVEAEIEAALAEGAE